MTRILAVLLLAPICCTAQSPASVRDPQAIALLQQCAATTGANAAAVDVYAVGSIMPTSKADSSGEIILKSKGYNRFRQEVRFPNRTEVAIANSGSGRRIENGVRQPMASWVARYQRPDFFPALICGFEATRADTNIVYLGVEPVGSTTAHHIQISVAPRGRSKKVDAVESLISEFHIYLDTQTLLPTKIKRFTFSPEAIENHSDWEVYYGKYLPVNGILMPFNVVCVIAGQPLFSVAFTDVRFNTGITDADFDTK